MHVSFCILLNSLFNARLIPSVGNVQAAILYILNVCNFGGKTPAWKIIITLMNNFKLELLCSPPLAGGGLARRQGYGDGETRPPGFRLHPSGLAP